MNVWRVLHCEERHERGKRFIKPEVIPPFHCNEVAEPHVCQFVQICNRELEALSEGWCFASEKIVLVECDTTNVLHRSKVVLRNKNLVVLSEWVGDSKKVFVESHAALSNSKHFVMVDRLNQSFTGVDFHGWHARCISFVEVERACNNCKKICRKAVRFSEYEGFGLSDGDIFKEGANLVCSGPQSVLARLVFNLMFV